MRDQLTLEEEARIEALMVEGYSYISAYRTVVLGHSDPMESEDDMPSRLRLDALPGYDAWKTRSDREGTE